MPPPPRGAKGQRAVLEVLQPPPEPPGFMGPLALELPGVIPRAEPSPPSTQNNKFTDLPPKSLLGRVGVSCRVLFSLLISLFLGFQQFLRPLRGTRTRISCHPLAPAAGEGLRTPGASRQRGRGKRAACSSQPRRSYGSEGMSECPGEQTTATPESPALAAKNL